MKKCFLLIFFILCSFLLAEDSNNNSVRLLELNYSDNDRTIYRIPKIKMATLPKWKPTDEGNIPLPMNKAVELSQKWLKEKNPKISEFKLHRFSIINMNIFSSNEDEKWYYEFQFSPILDGKMMFGTMYHVLVLFNGDIVEPQKIK